MLDNNLMVTIKGVDYTLATTLRVAYKIQGYNNHKSYMDVFKDVEKMPVEKQIELIYAAFTTANPGVMKAEEFQNYYLDNFNLKDLMMQMQAVIKGIIGEDEESEDEAPKEEVAEGNE